MPTAIATKRCRGCGARIERWLNYCNWDCMLAEAKKAHGTTIAPNGLPIVCIKADGTLLEHEEADHPGYRFPVDAEFTGTVPHDIDVDGSYEPCSLALLHACGNVVLTAYEHCYDIWRLDNGAHLGGSSWFRDQWRLTDASLAKIAVAVAAANGNL
jgi:hypothetical protein